MVVRAKRGSSYSVRSRKLSRGSKKVFVRKSKKPKQVCHVCRASRKTRVGKVRIHRRAERPFSSALCSKCLDAVLRYKARLLDGAISIEDVPNIYKRFVA